MVQGIERHHDIAAVICTTGDRACLKHAVASLAAQTLPPDRFHILVVLNRDDEALRRDMEAALAPPVLLVTSAGTAPRVVLEPTPGLSHARNRAILETTARHVAFLDDDAVAEPDWLFHILEGFGRDPSIAAVGGSILPLWETPPPAWVKPPLYTYFSCKSFGEAERWLGPGEYFFGTNMAFRRDVLLACGGFPVNLGRTGENLLSNEEWPVFRAIDARGLGKLASPRVTVRHRVPAGRMTARFFFRRLWWQGVSDTVFHLECAGRSRAFVVRKALADFARYYGALPRRLTAGQATWRLAAFNLARWLGIACALARHAPAGPPFGARPDGSRP
ncbi:glycosyltransferase [Desulfolutivibrio sulfoxidireducens]|uniref:glycosyltransferase n=1 Tax=Desulfolutivibrio sulfoxidireducens TaxID=2773299 RepID=UPI00159DAD94|nr:glycosyltransferase family A protein [Desulfolutivibrio sulfoxidireducens]QLA14807.1 glycosyltransferase [Desulfolutivibrio sulfoxidireducens]QLA18379.1 glycosyltransferase [Desulfolutivibrio sulfoxidireducens]